MSRELFIKFRENISVDNAGEISTSYANITKILNKEFYNSDSEENHSRQVGSYGRHTAIKGISDLDMIFEMPEELRLELEKYNKPQYELLSRVKRAIEKTYSKTKIRVDGQIISIRFRRYLIELVPVFKNNDGSYTNPDSNNGGSWKRCHPVAEIKALNKINNENNRNPKNLAKMIRQWKNTHGVPISGMLIDTFVHRFFQTNDNYKNVKFGSYDNLVKDFFQFLVNQDASQKFWRAPGSGSEVHLKGKFIPRAKKALRKCQEALDNKQVSQKKWREVFGKRFPTPTVATAANEAFDSAMAVPDYEQSIEDLFPLYITYDLAIKVEIEEGDKLINFLHKTLRSIRKNVKIHFTALEVEEIPQPYDIYWKVRNVGPEAIRKRMLRGRIEKGSKHHYESSDFDGPHYVECYVIKDDLCVARASVPVPIGNT